MNQDAPSENGKFIVSTGMGFLFIIWGIVRNRDTEIRSINRKL